MNKNGLTLPGYRAALRLDLKATTEWTDGELNRCVQRAVDDLSRFMALQKVYEVTTSFTVTDDPVTTPATASATAIVNAQTLNGKVDGDILTIADNTPDVPRRLTVKLTDADTSVTALTIIVKGYDADGHYVEESWYLKDLPTTVAVQGSKYFKYVNEVEVDDIAGTAAAGDTISVGTGNAYDSFVDLTYKPIRPKSETVTNTAGTTTYIRDTDYTIDYVNGRIKFINGGSMAAGTAYLVDYTKSRLGVDISAIIPDLVRITQVEYPADQIPQQFVSFNLWSDFMWIGSQRTGKSQEEMSTSKEHLVIYYECKQTPPGEVGPGSYPESLDEVVCIGAGAYALFIEAMQYEQQAATDLAALRSELGLTTAIHTLIAAALLKVTTYLTSNTNEDSKYWLTKITTDIANLRTSIEVAVDAVATNLGLVFTNSIDKATTGAEAYLDTGDGNIDAVNIGAEVGNLYAIYARTRGELANARVAACLSYIQEANIRLDNLRTYIQQAEGWGRIATGFVEEAQAEIAEIDRHLTEANYWAQCANGDMVLADRFRAEGLERLNEFYAILKSKAEWRRKVSVVPVHQPQ